MLLNSFGSRNKFQSFQFVYFDKDAEVYRNSMIIILFLNLKYSENIQKYLEYVKIDGFVKSRESLENVIPAKAEIQ